MDKAVVKTDNAIKPDSALRRKVEELSGQKVSACYQCQKCTCGCPVAFAMDIAPHKVIRLVNLGQVDKVLKSGTIWTCASCETCTTRCPNGIDIARVMDTLRHLSVKEGKASPKKAPQFHDTFLSSVRRHGKINELEMISQYTLKSDGIKGLMKQGTGLGLKMLRRGKLSPFPYRRPNSQVKKIFKQVKEHGGH